MALKLKKLQQSYNLVIVFDKFMTDLFSPLVIVLNKKTKTIPMKYFCIKLILKKHLVSDLKYVETLDLRV